MYFFKKNGVNKMTTNNTQNTMLVKPFLAATLLSLTIFLSACGGAGGGSQDPDPVLVDLPIAYVKRPIPLDLNDDDNDGSVDDVRPEDIFEPFAFNPGAALYIRDRASPGAPEINITDRAWPMGELYDVKDVEASSDGRLLVFAMRAPDDPGINDPFDQAKWNIWIYDLDRDDLSPLLPANEAQTSHDISPHFLPGSDVVVFTSDRQSKSRQVRLFEGKIGFSTIPEGANGNDPIYTMNLHTYDIASRDIKQITFNQSHDLQPTVLSNGKIMFLRWDNYGNTNDALSLYTVNPDGSDLQFAYGFHSQNTGTNGSVGVFTQPRELPDGQILVNLKPRLDERFGGDIVIIDGENFTEINQPTNQNAGSTDPGQVSGSLLEVFTYDVDDLADPDDLDDPNRLISPHGRFNSISPFNDGTSRLLVAWSQCRLIDPLDPDQLNPSLFQPCTDENLLPDSVTGAPPHEAAPLYGIWIYDSAEGTQLPIVPPEDGFMYSDVVAMTVQTRQPTVIPPLTVTGDQDLVAAGLGVVHIRSVYDFDGVDTTTNGIATTANPSTPDYTNRSARFLRLIKAVGQPDDDVLDIDNNSFGLANPRMMKEILGYVPIEPDGSAKFLLPEDMAVTFSVVDINGRRIPQFPRHQVWLQVRAAEQLECNGCHTGASENPHGRRNAEAPSANPGSATTAPFPSTQPTMTAEMGESMAETFARINGPRLPSVNLNYSDPWALTPPADIAINMSDLLTTSPVTPPDPCETTWDSLCRVVIDYPRHIQPMWDFARRDINDNVITCTNCHNKSDPLNMGATQVPAGQLELTSDLGDQGLNSNTNDLRSISYQDLLTADSELELNGAVLQRRVVIDVPEMVDADGNIIPAQTHNPVCSPTMGANSAITATNPRSSNIDCELGFEARDFFSWFAPGAPHDGYLNEAELKLISEWLDIGAQYYNSIVNAPLD